MIVLDLARVGTGTGSGTEALLNQLRALQPAVELIGGGGVRGAADLRRLTAAGYDRVLVASALHDGNLEKSKWGMANGEWGMKIAPFDFLQGSAFTGLVGESSCLPPQFDKKTHSVGRDVRN